MCISFNSFYLIAYSLSQALMDYIKNDFDMSVYWKTLNDNGITKERLLSYDRAIRSEPDFRQDQKDGLLRDLGHYMRTLKVRAFCHICMPYQHWHSVEFNNCLFVCVQSFKVKACRIRLKMPANSKPFCFT